MSASSSVHSGASKEYRELMKGGLGNGFHFTNRNKPVWEHCGGNIGGFSSISSNGVLKEGCSSSCKKTKSHGKMRSANLGCRLN